MKHIRTQVVVVFLLIVLLPLITLGTLSYLKSRQIVEDQLREDNLTLIKEVNRKYLEKYLAKIEYDVAALAGRIDMDRYYSDPEYKELLFDQWQVYRDANPHIDYVYLGTEDNELWVNPRYNPPEGHRNIDRPWYITAVKNKGKVAWTRPYREANSGVLTISAVKLLENNDGDKPLGVFCLTVSLSEISGLVNELATGQNVDIYILDDNGDVLANSAQTSHFISFADVPWVQDLLKQHEGSYLRNFDDGDKYVCHTTIDNTGWKLLALIPRGHLEAKIAPIRGLTVGIGLISALLAVILGYALSRKHFINPILQLIEQAEAIRRGNLDNSAGVKSSTEFQRLSMSINDMRLSIREKIANLKKSEQDLTAAKEEAEHSARVKSEFLANMSHEIRTPMNGIIGFCHLLMQTSLNSKQQDYLSKIKSQSQHLLGLINDILDFSKLEAGKMSIEHVEFNLEEIVADLFYLLENQASLKGLELLANIKEDVPARLIGDPLRLQQVLVNLTGNAIKFSENGNILLSVDKIAEGNDQPTIRFSVQDSGIGLTGEQIERLFASFSQADSSTTRKYGGTGLGLAISKHLVELMGGKIEVTSSYGTGSVFSFSLPLGIAGGGRSDQRSIPDLKGSRVLAVDDNETSLEIMASYLTNLGFEVSLSKSGQEAIDLVTRQGEEFDILIIDWKMPGLDGIETIRELKERMKLGRIPIIIMASAYDLDELKTLSRDLGIKAFLNKPHTPSQLMDAVSAAYNRFDHYLRPRDLKEESLFTGKLAGNHILLVEDNIINRQVAGEILRSVGITVDMAENGKVAVEKVKAGKYDLVLMDLQMPVMDGMEATRILRGNPANQKLPIIALTAHAISGFREQCLQAGMNDFLSKPFLPENMLTIISKYLSYRSRESEQQLAAGIPGQGSSHYPGEKLERLQGIDHRRVLENLRGNGRLLAKLLLEFCRSFARAPAQMEAALTSGDTEAARLLAHSIKGSAGNLGAMALYEAASALEAALRQKKAVSGGAEHKDFCHSLNMVLDNYSSLLEINQLFNENKGGFPAENPEEIRSYIVQLREMLRANSFDAGEFAARRLNKPVFQGEKLDRLLQAIGEFQYEQALSLLAELESQLLN